MADKIEDIAEVISDEEQVITETDLEEEENDRKMFFRIWWVILGIIVYSYIVG
jgi:hypothetical protein